MSSKNVNPNNKNISIENSNQKSIPCAVANCLSSSHHHVRHHSYDTTSNSLASQIFPSSRLNRKENNLNNLNENSHSHFLPPRSSHRHTSSYASDRSSFTNLNSNHYHEHHYSASQENLRRKFNYIFFSTKKKENKHTTTI
jgi:hypothetical protein